ncbi:hypothetical protein T4D_16807 [Trichinella pseudospiralis]|uniref:Uncharacterized protein n=1 Tax=Trichinella pseudospiralis TaxID=6337 RepID=A0A0V1G1N9_TRIPS|nr:hypothetical protein T4D_16807 [Trichinella pseudospiralis]
MIITKLKNIVIQIFILNGDISCEPKSDYLLLIEDDVLSKLPSEDFFSIFFKANRSKQCLDGKQKSMQKTCFFGIGFTLISSAKT